MSQVLDIGLSKGTLFQSTAQSVVLKLLEQTSKVLQVFFSAVGANEDVIKVGCNSWKFLSQLVHDPFEVTWGRGYSKSSLFWSKTPLWVPVYFGTLSLGRSGCKHLIGQSGEAMTSAKSVHQFLWLWHWMTMSL